MSYQNFQKAIKLAPSCEFYTCDNGKTPEEILKSEKLLGIKFSKQNLEFYQTLGYLSFHGNEVYGIDPVNFKILEGNSVAHALSNRKRYKLPKEWLPIYNYGYGPYAFLDYSHLNAEDEPRVIVAFYNGDEYVIEEVIAEDFGDFLLQLVETSINEPVDQAVVKNDTVNQKKSLFRFLKK